jgi:hypothetical protein
MYASSQFTLQCISLIIKTIKCTAKTSTKVDYFPESFHKQRKTVAEDNFVHYPPHLLRVMNCNL